MEANQVYYRRGRGFELGTAENKSSYRSVRNLNSGPLNYKFSALTIQPPNHNLKLVNVHV